MRIIEIPFPLESYDGKVDGSKAEEIWVRSKDFPSNIARKIVELVDSHGQAHVCTIGAESINQAIKGLAVARQMWRDLKDDQDLYGIPYFSTVLDQDDHRRTRMVTRVFPLKDADVTHCLHQSPTEPDSG